MKKALLVLAVVPMFLQAQSRKERKALEAQQKADLVVAANLKSHVQNLSDNTAGSNAEAKTTEYISNQFKLIGLEPKGANGFLEAYTVDDGKKIAPSTYLKINDKVLEVNKEYFPLPYSAEKKVTGMPAMALRERGVPWFLDLKDWLQGDTKIQPANMEEAIKKEIARVSSKGATALFLYNSSSLPDNVAYDGKEKSTASAIPVVYITQDGYKKYFNDHSEMLDVDLNVAFKDGTITGTNIIGLLNNSAPSTVVIATTYDFSDGLASSSLETKVNEQPSDNRSSIALMIELAKMLSASKAKSNNYLFVAFGGADKGVVASNYWLENSVATFPVNYIIHLDLDGGLTDNKKVLVQGFKSSPVWADALGGVAEKKIDLAIDSANNTLNRYAAFDKKAIPQLLFSLRPKNYAVATEEAKVNFEGEVQVAKMISRLVEMADTKGKIAFSKIPEQPVEVATVIQQVKTTPIKSNETSVTSAATVSLGVIPDKITNEAGLKIIGVSQKKLASKLGLQAGDVLTELGTYKISDLKTYMQALSNFKTGDKTTLRIKRGKDDKEFAVEF